MGERTGLGTKFRKLADRNFATDRKRHLAETTPVASSLVGHFSPRSGRRGRVRRGRTAREGPWRHVRRRCVPGGGARGLDRCAFPPRFARFQRMRPSSRRSSRPVPRRSLLILTRRRVVSTRRMHDTRAFRASPRRRRGAALGRAQGSRVGQADAARIERRVRLRQVAVARDRLRRDRQGHQDVDVEGDRGEGDREARDEARRPVAEVRAPSRPARSSARPDPTRGKK